MNDYRELRVEATPCDETITDVLAQFLSEVGYESFVADESGVTAFIKEELFDRKAVDDVLSFFPIEGVSFEVSDKFVEGRDWNEEWEKNYFKPIVVGNECVIHSSFHTDYPKCRHDIVIDPKMAFGTGHHQTTSLIIGRLLEMDLKGKSMIDMGTGTGILAILAAMRGAGPVTAIEIDEMAYENAVENVSINGHSEIDVKLGDAGRLDGLNEVDVFVANINRNVITADLCNYVKVLRTGGVMLLSGFYVDDIDIVMKEAEKYDMVKLGHNERDRWACLILEKR